MIEISWGEFINKIASIEPAMWCAMLTILVVYIIELFLYVKGYIFCGGEKRIERAKTSGHMVVGKLVRSKYNLQEYQGGSERLYGALYEYDINGKKYYKKMVVKGIRPNMTITLLYDRNPKKVYTENEIPRSNWMFLFYIVPVLAGGIVGKLCGL